MAAEARVPNGQAEGGQYARQVNDDADIALASPPTDQGAVWVPGKIHPTGGYDEVQYDAATDTTRYLLDGDPHRENGPAISYGDGTEEWYYEGALHRDDDLPAAISSTGEREWRKYGVQHRDGGKPAVVMEDGTQLYLVDGTFHRAGGEPAVIYPSGHTEWWVDGMRHRTPEYGPARIRSNGEEEYWVAGKRITTPKGK